jgi:hypothetical protein
VPQCGDNCYTGYQCQHPEYQALVAPYVPDLRLDAHKTRFILQSKLRHLGIQVISGGQGIEVMNEHGRLPPGEKILQYRYGGSHHSEAEQ